MPTRRDRAAEQTAPRAQRVKPRGTRPTERDSRAEERKEKVLHTRVSEQLAEDIYRAAEDLRVPVSNLVRNVLEDVFSVVESVTDNVGDLIEDVIGRADRTREQLQQRAGKLSRSRHRMPETPASERGLPPGKRAAAARKAFPEVIGWQPVILNQDQSCAQCGQMLRAGAQAVIGLTPAGVLQTYLCRGCLDAGSP